MTAALRRATATSALLVLAFIALSGCGQMGPLTLPGPDATVTADDQSADQDQDQDESER